MSTMQLHSPLTTLSGVGPALAQKFKVLGMTTIEQLLDNYPRRYEDYSVLTPTSGLRPGPVTIEAHITQVTGRYVRRGMHITEAIASDTAGSVRLVWFNQPYRAAAIKPGAIYYISGLYQLSRQRFTVMNPSLELASDFPINTARIIPVYRETRGLSSRQIRLALGQILSMIKRLPETLPIAIINEQKLISRAEALQAIHFPESPEQLETARRRLGFEEVLQLTMASLLNKRENQSEAAVQVPFDQTLAKGFVSHLPFKLTDAQRQVAWQIYKDMRAGQPMNRLIEGDVGSGKTVVAAMAAIMALHSGLQVALMAPTELLARQHAGTLHQLLQPIGLADQVGLLVGSMKVAQKQTARAAIAGGNIRFIIGTQALLQEHIAMDKLVLIIIDEQHRFGVNQRKLLQAKAGHMPHVLSLTATPIPRSLALTLYGELDVSILATKPAGRQPIITELISPNSRAQLYTQIDKCLAAEQQMFVVCPLIRESSLSSSRSAEQVYKELSAGPFKHRRVGLLHGKLKPAEKIGIMKQFIDRKLDILVSTTVIEVGVDVPNAAIMLIEEPERFGLAQLHQLRGRVGRGSAQAYCYALLADSKAPSRRLRAFEGSQDGFRLAELDLELRGPGEIYGAVQHGQLDLRIAKLSDTKLVAGARNAAQKFLDSGQDLLQYKELAAKVMQLRAVTNLN